MLIAYIHVRLLICLFRKIKAVEEYRMITLTETAVKEVRNILEQQDKSGWGLRLGVKGGGCSGLSYILNFDENPKENDQVFDFDGVPVYVDAKSYLYLNGTELDYSYELLDGGFKFKNPNAAKSCGCGQSFS
jgi:iron-sulfur cluster assembly protein